MIHDSFIYCTILQKELSVYSSLNIFFYFFLNIQLSSSFSSSYFELRTFTHHAEIPFLNFSQDTCHPHILFLHLLSPFSILFFFYFFLFLPCNRGCLHHEQIPILQRERTKRHQLNSNS